MPEKQKIDFKPKVIEYVQKNGPSLPVQVSKVIGREIYVSSAVLSELISSRKMLITAAKVGSSPLYYLPGQEYKLQTLLYPYLKDKEKEAFDLLKKNLVLKDSNLEPAIRVALRYLRDFAFQVEVKEGVKSELYWKWYILPDEEAKSKILKMIGHKEEIKIVEEIKEEPKKIEKQEVTEEPKPQESIIEKIKSKIIRKPRSKDNFEEILYTYLQNNNIKVINSEVIKKNKEINMTVKIPSIVGDLLFYVKALHKAKLSTTDLLTAYNESQQKNINGLLLTTGEVASKFCDFIDKKLNNKLMIKQIK